MLLVILPVQCFVVYYNTTLSMPWHTYSWSRIHTGSRWNTIVKTPTNGHAFYDRWVPIAANFLVFIFFGSGNDANDLYRAFLWNLGLGRCFACLTPGYSRRTSMSSSTTSRVKLLFHKRWSSATRYVSTFLLRPLSSQDRVLILSPEPTSTLPPDHPTISKRA